MLRLEVLHNISDRRSVKHTVLEHRMGFYGAARPGPRLARLTVPGSGPDEELSYQTRRGTRPTKTLLCLGALNLDLKRTWPVLDHEEFILRRTEHQSHSGQHQSQGPGPGATRRKTSPARVRPWSRKRSCTRTGSMQCSTLYIEL